MTRVSSSGIANLTKPSVFLRIAPILARVFQARQSGTMTCTVLSAADTVSGPPADHRNRTASRTRIQVFLLFIAIDSPFFLEAFPLCGNPVPGNGISMPFPVRAASFDAVPDLDGPFKKIDRPAREIVRDVPGIASEPRPAAEDAGRQADPAAHEDFDRPRSQRQVPRRGI